MDNLTNLSLRDFLSHIAGCNNRHIRDKDGYETPWKPSATQKRLMEMFAKIPHKPIRIIMLKTTRPPDCSPMICELWRQAHEPR